jgi:hypothetical protein
VTSNMVHVATVRRMVRRMAYSEMHHCCQRCGDSDAQRTGRSKLQRFFPIHPTMNQIMLIA